MARKLAKRVEYETNTVEKMRPIMVELRPATEVSHDKMAFRLKRKQETLVIDVESIYRFVKSQALIGRAVLES
jgi:hypothetical protein